MFPAADRSDQGLEASLGSSSYNRQLSASSVLSSSRALKSRQEWPLVSLLRGVCGQTTGSAGLERECN